MFLVGAFAPAIKEDLGFGDASFGAVFTVGFFVSAVVIQVSGQGADRLGARRMIRIGLIVSMVGALALGTVATSFWLLLLAFSITRASEGMVQPAVNTLISEGVPTHQRGRSIGFKQAAIPLSTALAGISVPLLGDWIGWEGVILLVVPLAVPAWFFLPTVQLPSHKLAQSRTDLWRARHLQIIALGASFGAAGVVTVPSFLTTAAEEAGFSKGGAGLLLTLGGVVMIVSRLVLGSLADRFAFDRFVGVGCAVGVGSLSYVAFATESKPLIVAGTALLFGVGWAWPGLLILGVIERHPNEPGAASAVVQTSVRIGAMFSPVLFGVVADHAGFGVAWFVPFGFAIVGASLLLASSRIAQ
jgi:MFS family permease